MNNVEYSRYLIIKPSFPLYLKWFILRFAIPFSVPFLIAVAALLYTSETVGRFPPYVVSSICAVLILLNFYVRYVNCSLVFQLIEDKVHVGKYHRVSHNNSDFSSGIVYNPKGNEISIYSVHDKLILATPNVYKEELLVQLSEWYVKNT